MLAALGDIYESILIEAEETKIISKSSSASGVVDTKVSTTDALVLKAGTQEYRVGKSRYTIEGGDPTLVWRQGAAPSTYLINGATIAGAQSAGEFISGFDLEDSWYQYENQEFLGEYNLKQQGSATGRLPSALVKKVEDLSEGEYMPFYFHDLRTNEITGFHAFLTSLTDSYTANYDSNQGYGRADPVMIYNNTQRSIGLTFWVVSTNPQDYDEMWWKINKLTTLLYPQYSAGTQVVAPGLNEDAPFTAPFSQVIAASPMIRLRLGDLFKSNYSKFGLARIFGAAEMTENVGADPEAASVKAAIEAVEDIQSKLDASAVPGYAEPPLLGGVGVKFVSRSKVNVMIMKSDKEKLREVIVPDGMIFEITGITPTVESIMKALDSGDFGNISKYGLAECKLTTPAAEGDNPIQKAGAQVTNALKYDTFTAAMKLRGLDLNKIIIPYYILAKPNLFKPVKGSIPTPPTDPGPAVDLIDFLSADNNPVTKAFESTAGRGLAGFITSMDFQWLDQITWETSAGSKAPKACAITISFSPVHDIGPGLAADGMNRAPIYNVGTSVGQLSRGPYKNGTEDDA